MMALAWPWNCAALAVNAPHELLSGPALKQQLAAPVKLTWARVPLRQALASLGESQNIAIVLDRRIDPDQPVDLIVSQEPLERVLRRIAECLQAGYRQLGPVAYLGPSAAAERLRTLAALRLEDVRGLPIGTSGKFVQLRAWKWDDAAEPRQLALRPGR